MPKKKISAIEGAVRTQAAALLKGKDPDLAIQFAAHELQEVAEHIVSLLEANWPSILDTTRENEGKSKVSIGISLDHTGQHHGVKINLSYSVKTTDEAEFYVKDPRQAELDL